MNEAAGKQGLAARAGALRLYQAVVRQGRQLDEALEARDGTEALEPRDAAFSHAVAAAALRHHGQLTVILAGLLQKPLPRSAGPTQDILLLGLAQLLVLRASAPAAINLSVELARQDRHAAHFTGLVNGVLREAQRRQPALGNPRLNLPQWLQSRLDQTYGPETTDAIAAAHTNEAAVDVSARQDAAGWASRLHGDLLPTGTIRLAGEERGITALPGFAEGAWWVQDAAAALPVKLLGQALAGLTALDLCAAPGGKTAQLASLGARVTAVDISKPRMARLQQNMARLQLEVSCQVTDLRKLPEGDPYDIVVLDAPCSSTGTMRRHPDLAHLKSASQIDKLLGIQRDMLREAARRTKPGGSLLYCVCSLLAEEGEHQAMDFLASEPRFSLRPGRPEDVGNQPHFLTAEGYLRTLPCMPISPHQGLDGFFAAHFVRH